MAPTPLRQLGLIATLMLACSAGTAIAQQPANSVPPYSIDLNVGQAMVGFHNSGRSGAMLALGGEVALDDSFALRTQVEAGTAEIISAGFRFRRKRLHPDLRSANEMGFAAIHAPGGWRPSLYLGLGSDHYLRNRTRALSLRGRIYLGSHNAGLSLNLGYKWLWR